MGTKPTFYLLAALLFSFPAWEKEGNPTPKQADHSVFGFTGAPTFVKKNKERRAEEQQYNEQMRRQYQQQYEQQMYDQQMQQMYQRQQRYR